MKATTKAEMIKAMSDSFDYGTAVIKEFDNTTIQGTIQAPFMGPSTRARIMFFLSATRRTHTARWRYTCG